MVSLYPRPVEERRYGRFAVLETLGAGGMGEVYRAHDDRLGRDVAIKTIRNVAGLATDTFRSRFLAEARALAAISHPGIVHIHDVGIERDEPFLVLELVDGPSLKQLLANGPLPAEEVRAMGVQIARALAAAHARGVLHRDLKPANILRGADGVWKLADFGIARVPDSDLTMTGQFLGTPAYAAPESLVMSQFSEKSDVYSLASTMAEAATGARLRDAAGVTELLHKGDLFVDLPPSIPPTLARGIRPALAIDPKNRPDAAELAELLVADPVAVAPQVSSPRMPRMPRLPSLPAVSPRTKKIALVVGALLAIGVLAAIFAGGGGEPEHKIRVVYPAALDRSEYAAFTKVVEHLQRKRFGDALRELDRYERKYEPTAETRALRAQLVALPASMRD